MIFRQLYDPTSSTYTYVLGCADAGEAVLIDPVFEQHDRDAALIRELGLQVRYVLDTHVHADHVTAAWLMKQRFGAETVLSGRYDAHGVDIEIDDGDVLAFGNCALNVRATPGHTAGCVTYVCNSPSTDEALAFTGDCLMIRGAGRTDFQGGSAATMWRSIREQIFSLNDNCLIYPGHDYAGRTVSTVAEEKRFNPRIGGEAHEEDFVGYMDNLGLPHPRLLDIAVPANLRSGEPEGGELPPRQDWGPITVTFAGVPEIRPDWVARHTAELCLLDVRNEPEFGGELGHVQGADLIPLHELRDRVDDVCTDRPIVTICQSGKRSAMAAQILLSAGRQQVANLPGGMLHWNRLGLPVVGAA